MKLTHQMANQFREVLLNGKWVVGTNFKDAVSDLSWEQATTRIGSLNTIASLVFHVNYYIAGVVKVLEGGTLDIRDKYSFDMPPIESQEDWEKLTEKMWSDAERFAARLEEMPEEKLLEGFVEEKYGNYHRNISAIIEHCYYHLGQIVIIKKMINGHSGNLNL